MRLLSYILWTQEIISLMVKKKEMIVLIIFWGKELSMKPVVMIQLYLLWCLFAYREFYKNLLAILDELSLHTFGEKTSIPNRFCKHFCLHDDEKIHAYLMKLSNNNNSDSGFSYETVMNSQKKFYPFRDNLTMSILTGKHTNNERYC